MNPLQALVLTAAVLAPASQVLAGWLTVTLAVLACLAWLAAEGRERRHRREITSVLEALTVLVANGKKAATYTLALWGIVRGKAPGGHPTDAVIAQAGTPDTKAPKGGA